MVADSENAVTNETKMKKLIIVSSQANAYIAHLIFGSNKFGEWKKKKKKKVNLPSPLNELNVLKPQLFSHSHWQCKNDT